MQRHGAGRRLDMFSTVFSRQTSLFADPDQEDCAPLRAGPYLGPAVQYEGCLRKRQATIVCQTAASDAVSPLPALPGACRPCRKAFFAALFSTPAFWCRPSSHGRLSAAGAICCALPGPSGTFSFCPAPWDKGRRRPVSAARILSFSRLTCSSPFSSSCSVVP